jgi:hypothetical protein
LGEASLRRRAAQCPGTTDVATTLYLEIGARKEIVTFTLGPECSQSDESAVAMLPLSNSGPEGSGSFVIRAAVDKTR